MSSSRRAWKRFSALALSIAASAAYAYPAWQADTYYAAGTIVTYNGADYMALVNQTDYVATGWTPAPASLWQPLGTSGGDTTSPPPSNPPPSNPPPSSGGGGSGGGGTCAPAWSAASV